jgi:SAM-dependent methyltransferase
MSVSESSNAEHIDFWNDVLAEPFIRFRSMFVAMGDAHSRGPLDRLGLKVGDRVLDVGCGFGETTLQIAERVRPGGTAVGTDCCEPFLAIARDDAVAAGVDNAEFLAIDAQTHPFQPEFDVVFARFGTMFFQNPTAGMRNIGGALKPGGRLLMVVWRPLEANHSMSFAKEIVERHIPPPPDDAPNCGPGPFSMADPAVVETILRLAGYVDIGFEQVDVLAKVGSTVEEAMSFQLSLGPAAAIFREGGDLAEEKRPAIEAEMREVLGAHARPDGVYMETSSWAVTARRA